MAILKADRLEAFLRRPDPALRALLIYGGDSDEVATVARRVVRALAGADPLAVVELDDRTIGQDPGRLADEVQSLSLLGGRRVIWVRGADSHFARAVPGILSAPAAGNFIVAEAGSLNKSSALRAAFEESTVALCLPLYEPSTEQAADFVTATLSASELKISQEALARLLELVGLSSALLAKESEKLALYCHGRSEVTLADVNELCAAGGEATFDDLVFAAFGGDPAMAAQEFTRLLSAGEDAGRIATVAHQHVARLLDLRQAVDRGTSPQQAVRAARPPIFFKVQDSYASELGLWPTSGLLAVAKSLQGTIRDARGTPALASAIVGRTLLAVARQARSARLERI